MTPELPHDDSPRGQQRTAVLALAQLLEHDLPAAEWTIADDEDGELNGQIFRRSLADGDDEQAGEVMAALTAWSAFLAERIETTAGADGTFYEVSATYREAPVVVWAMLRDGPKTAVQPVPGSEIPGRPGQVVGECGHWVTADRWQAGQRVCERCTEDGWDADPL
ncbi:hypothetical protein [Actinomadura parmotrematis]|uniref:Uncharacterized protein n=1 Tax=Actinomadura parmotrematis TaxID=2864039 RepID=A0ABS7FP20_9ACTN|nr:hypothetical protein [Actinomadura parmotrematis]MBW8482135.1 hypothetical protein [Actinomadura parmotrematis]